MKDKDNRIWRWFATAATCFVMVAAGASLIKAASAQEGSFELVTPARPAPDVSYFDAEGKQLSLADLKGKVVIVHFWAKWCAPCLVELPEMQKAMTELASEDLVFLPLSLDQKAETVKLFFAQNNFDIPVLMDRKSEAMRAFGMRGLPSTVLIDRKGQVIAQRNGVLNWTTTPTRALISGALKAE